MHVLVVDGNLLSQTRLTSQMRQAGWEVTAVVPDPEVLARGCRDLPDAVVVNLASEHPSSRLTPDVTSDAVGRAAAFVRALRGAKSWAQVPVLGFCGHTDRRRREEGLASGCTKVETNAAVASHVTELIRALTATGSDRGGS